MADLSPSTPAPGGAASTITRLPTAAQRKVPHRYLNGEQLAERGIKRILPTVEVIDPRSEYPAALIVAEAILAQLQPEQRRAAQNAVHRVYQEIGGDQARAASAFMAGVR